MEEMDGGGLGKRWDCCEYGTQAEYSKREIWNG